MISVVLPVRDGLPWLEDQLRALADQRCDDSWELVVADNGSRDGSGLAATRWADRIPALRVVDASHARGPAAARNAGARAAVGSTLVFCDADDVVEPGWLQALCDGLATADVAGGVFDMGSLNGAGRADPRPPATTQLGFRPAALASNLAVRRPVFESVGGFAEDLLVGEDIDLCWRLQLQGYRFALVPGAVVAKREDAALGALFRRAVAYGRCGPRLYRRHRAAGMRRDVAGACRSWAWLVVSVPLLYRRLWRRRWVRALGVRLGRLAGSVGQRVFFP